MYSRLKEHHKAIIGLIIIALSLEPITEECCLISKQILPEQNHLLTLVRQLITFLGHKFIEDLNELGRFTQKTNRSIQNELEFELLSLADQHAAVDQ